jgi:peptidyl-prolyl cis-trans isomerase SurA
MVAPFEDAAYALEEVGDVSAPVRSRFGYHLIKLLEIGELPTFEEAYDDVKGQVQRLPRFQEAHGALTQRLKGEMNPRIDTTALSNLTSGFSPDSTLFALAIEPWTDEQRSTVLATMGGREFTLADFLEFGSRRRESAPSSFDFAETVATLDRMLTERAIDVAASKLEDTDADFRDLMNEYRDGIVLFRIMEDSVWNRANTDTLGLMKMYEANAESYRFPDRKRIISFYSSSDSTLKEIAARWSPNDTTDWAGLVGEEGFRIDTTFISDSTNSIYDVALSLEPGETSAPTQYRRGFMLFALDGIEAPRRKTFKEARADIVTAYQSRLEEIWLARLRAKYGAELYPENLLLVFRAPDSGGVRTGG